MPTDIGVGMTRDLNGGIFYAQSSGITTASLQNTVTQVYIQNQGQSGNVYITGDEDPTFSTTGLQLSPGDALGLSWRTKNLYIKGSAAQIPVQVQGWY